MDIELLEKLAELEHVQWCEWAKSVSINLDDLISIIENHDLNLNDRELKSLLSAKEKLNRWEGMFIPYCDLSEDMKDKDRAYAKSVLNIVDNQQ